MTNERLARTYAQVMTTHPVLEGVIQRLDLPPSVGYLQPAIHTNLQFASVDWPLRTLLATSPSPDSLSDGVQ